MTQLEKAMIEVLSKILFEAKFSDHPVSYIELSYPQRMIGYPPQKVSIKITF